MKIRNFTLTGKRLVLFLVFLWFNGSSKAQVTEIYTDYGGYWKSTVASNNSIKPDNSNNVLGFTYNSVIYSTGVNDALLTTKGVFYTSANFKALPLTSIGGTIVTGGSTFIALGTLYDGVANGYSTPLPSLRMNDVLTDGINGLNIGTGITNIPATASITFPISNIVISSISDTKPDILFSQTAQPAGAGDKLYFINSSGAIVGDTVAVTWTSVGVLGTYSCDLYTLSNSTCDAAIITGGNLTNQLKDIRLVGLLLSQFNLTAGNAGSVVSLIIKPGGMSDPAFVAYNTDALSIPSPVITVQPQTQVICPAGGNNVTFSVTATGAGLTYQWKKNGVAIVGATSSAYTISNVSAADAGGYEVAVSNTGGTITSSIAYLNTVISLQPSPSSQTVATGNTITLSITATNATGYQWLRNGTNISGATSASYTMNPLTTSNSGSFQVSVNNSASGGCANVLSSVVTVTPSTILYSKSTGNLNVAANWGVNTNGTGSTPVNFTRSEHTFKVSNQVNAATGGDLTIAGTLDVMDAVTAITPGSTLSAAQIIRSGTTGTLAGSSTSNLIVSGTSTLYFTTGSQVLKNLTISGGTSLLNTPLSITAGTLPGTVIVSAGTLNTSGNLTLKSDINGTSMVGASAGAITGNVTVERYISAHKAWRFLSIPTNTTQTVKQTWQEGATDNTSNPVSGYGIQITGAGGTAAGFDLYSATPSMKRYNPANNTWVGIANTNTVTIKATDGYMVFVRGDRTANAFNSVATQTVLRSNGDLYMGDLPSITVNANEFTAIGNPYPSALDMPNITKTGLKDFFYLWDPNLGGNYGLGGYQTFSYNGMDYIVTPGLGSYGAVGSANNYIKSGQAFFVQGAGTGGSLTFKEAAKTSSAVVSVAAPVPQPQLRTSLFGVNTDSSTYMIDGVLSNYDDSYSNNVDDMDAIKFSNVSENLSIKNGNTLLVVERRFSIVQNDTIFLNLTGEKVQKYRFEFSAVQLDRPELTGFLEDSYLHTSTQLNLSGTTAIDFNIVNMPGSSAANRFRVVFKPATVLPLTFMLVKAYQENEGIAVEWKTENESNLKQYSLEKSVDGNQYIPATTVAANNTASGIYNWLDVNPSQGYNYYRILSTGVNGKKEYSIVVKVFMANVKQSISIYPNPLVNGNINLLLTNQSAGVYGLKLINNMGQVIISKEINHAEGSSSETIQLDKYSVHGVYQLEVMKPGGNTINMHVIY
ncbi:MAG: immunoglobulin domain-containing protein [Ginsengibacter sp.]